VVKLSKAELSDGLIIQKIKKKEQHFDLFTDQLIQLKTASVSDRVIHAMIDPNSTCCGSFVSDRSRQPQPSEKYGQRENQARNRVPVEKSLPNSEFFNSYGIFHQ
jgi:hypothetical protein